ncbi:MAG: Phenylalanine--tRNA ligase beta subunit [Chlamydiia bacterium]|nr:Phenylalanine--tRNA ligase beta subunit [Chlamydiia bacterium]
MLVPIEWIHEFTKPEISIEALAERLTMAGLEVEAITGHQFIFSNVITAKVLEVKPHPNAKKLQIATVSDGKKEVQVVCGASNCRAGLITAFAQVGATIGPINITPRSLRDVDSFGMLCALKELALGEENEGIVEFPADTPLGLPLEELFHNPVLDIALTPNLGHCKHIFGIAREIAALTDTPIHAPAPASLNTTGSIEGKVTVTIDDPVACTHFTTRMITNVKIGPSPRWLQKRLESVGLTPINNVVDATNYIMYERGQPLHAYDFDQLPEKNFRIGRAKEGETLTTLDGIERKMVEGAILIYDGATPVGIGGIMGENETAISEKTSTIVLEAAAFNPQMIRSTSRKIGLRTDASSRFETGTDHKRIIDALNACAHLIQEHAGGEVLAGISEAHAQEVTEKQVSYRPDWANQLLGTNLSRSEMEEFLKRLEIYPVKATEERVWVTAPTYRNDLNIEADIVEEIARVYGYENITGSPNGYQHSNIPHSDEYLTDNAIRETLIRQGLQEVVTCPLISPERAQLELKTGLFEESLLEVVYAKNSSQSLLRPSLLPGMLDIILHNQNHYMRNIHCFEVGHVFYGGEEEKKEVPVLAIAWVGENAPYNYDRKPRPADFFDIKGVVENLTETLGLTGIDYVPSNYKTFHPHIQCRIMHGDEQVGVIGQVHPDTLHTLSIDQPVYFAEILTPIFREAVTGVKQYQKVPDFPSSTRDITLTIPVGESIGNLMNLAKNAGGKLLEDVALRDIYTGGNVDEGMQNVTFRMTYRDLEKTLEDQMVDDVHAQVTKHLTEKKG